MAPKKLLPLIQQLRRWRQAKGLRQAEAARVLREAGIPVTTDSLQAWEIGRWNPRAPVALALAEFLQRQPKGRSRRRSKDQDRRSFCVSKNAVLPERKTSLPFAATESEAPRKRTE